MAPEMVHQWKLTFRFNFAPDIWSFGVLVHQLMHAGATPHEKFLKAGRMRLLLSIFDKDSLCAVREADWIVEGRGLFVARIHGGSVVFWVGKCGIDGKKCGWMGSFGDQGLFRQEGGGHRRLVVGIIRQSSGTRMS